MDHLKEVVDALALQSRDFDRHNLSTHRFDQQACVSEFTENAIDVGAGKIRLIDGNDYGDPGRLRVGDGLARLRHYAVVGSHNQHDDVGDLGAARPHRGEGLMAGSVDEGDRATLDLDLIGADALGDPTGLAGDDVALAEGVEQGRLAVVDVPHHRHHRPAGTDLAFDLGDVADRGFELRLRLRFGKLGLDPHVSQHEGGGLEIESGVDVGDDAATEQLSDQLHAGHVDQFGEFANVDRFGQRHLVGTLDYNLFDHHRFDFSRSAFLARGRPRGAKCSSSTSCCQYLLRFRRVIDVYRRSVEPVSCSCWARISVRRSLISAPSLIPSDRVKTPASSASSQQTSAPHT